MSISDKGKTDLDWWIQNLPRAQKRIWVTPPQFELATDACDYGWGAVFTHPEREKTKTNGLWSISEKGWHINIKETMAVWLGLSTFGKDLKACAIKCYIDNTTAIVYLNHQGAMKNADCDRICRLIWVFCQVRLIWLWAVHIPVVDNQEADHESRVTVNTEWELPGEVFQDIQKTLGPIEMDLLASRISHKLPRYVSWLPDPFAEKVNAFSFCWTNIQFYAFPLFSLILKTVRKAVLEQAHGILITPTWTAQPWFPKLKKIAEIHRLGKISLRNTIDQETWALDLAAWRM